MILAATTPPRLLTLIGLTGLSTVSLNLFLPSLAHMAADFETSYALVSLAVAGYLGMTAVLQLILGPLSDRYGRRPVALGALLIFVLASTGCMLARDIGVFLAFRLLQGVMITGWVVALAAIRDTAPAREAASRIGYLSMAMALAPMLGPVLGGVLDAAFGWRASFLTFAILGVAMWGLCWLDFGETHHSRSSTVWQQFQAYPALFQAPLFWGYALCTAFSTGAFYTFLAGAPWVASVALALSPAALGFYIGTITAGFMLGSFLSGRYAQRIALSTMMLTGRIVACAALTLGLGATIAGYVHSLVFFGTTVFVGIGNGLTLPSSNAGALSVHPSLAGSAAGLLGASTVAIGALLTSSTGALLTDANAVYAVLGMMLFCSLLGLAAALFVQRFKQHKSLESKTHGIKE